MIKLKHLLKEMMNGPKAIIMAGGSSVGKSTFLKKAGSIVDGFEIINADKYVEDKDSPMYNNLAAASSHVTKIVLPDTIDSKRNLIYDTTSGSVKTTTALADKLKSNGYDVMMVMIYAHPIVSLVRNFKRERKVPARAIISTWVGAYSLINDYKRIFGDKFVLVSPSETTDEENAEISKFEAAMKEGKLKEYIQEFLSTGDKTSTFVKKNKEDLTPEELEKKRKEREKAKEVMNANIDKMSGMLDKIKTTSEFEDADAALLKVRNFVG